MVVPPAFTHRDEGTPESQWWASSRWDDVPTVDLSAVAERYTRVLIVSAHPDDETLGVGATMADLATMGVPITVMVVTDGEKCLTDASEESQTLMGRRRRDEVKEAVGILASDARLLHLGLPDGDLTSREAQLSEEITRLSDANTLILAPWINDGHPDHDALGRAAITASCASGAQVVHFPIWVWHWGTPEVLQWEPLVIAEASMAGCRTKRDAVASFTSQLYSSGAPIIGEGMRARSRRLLEVLIDAHGALPLVSTDTRVRNQDARSARFDDMYDDGPDPWNNGGSFYEGRRRELILAMLGSTRYRRVLELGCADGFLTAALVTRADEVLSCDTSSQAVAAARMNAPTAAVLRGDLPGVIPDTPQHFDLIVISEVGYFLSATELLATLRRALAALAPGGELLLCHWQHPTRHVPLDGALVHQQARDFLGSEPKAVMRDADVCVEIWGDGPSVAVKEGRA